MPLRRLFVAALIAAATATPALAIDTVLTPATVDRAFAQGRAMAEAHRGFTVAPYLIFGVDDAAQVHDDAPVEAVELATPYEAVRYRGFLSGFEHTPMTAAALAVFAADARTHVDLRVFVHNSDPTDRNFLTTFGDGALECADGTRIPATLERSAPIRDVYLNGTTPTYRWRGQLTYRFALTPTLLNCHPATFTFTGAANKIYHYPLDLSTYQ
jgi:hypothetical protein